MKTIRIVRRAFSALSSFVTASVARLADNSLDRVISDFTKTEKRLTRIIDANDKVVELSFAHLEVLQAAIDAERSFRVDRYMASDRAERIRRRVKALID